MRGIGSAFSRLPAARVIMAGAAILAGAAASATHGQEPTEDVALLVPSHSASGVPLPQPLAPSDAVRLRRIFALQAEGQMSAAMEEASRAPIPLLDGHLRADRYERGGGDGTLLELEAWLAQSADQPDAPEIRALLKARQPPGLRIPTTIPHILASTDPVRRLQRSPALERSMRDPVRAGRFDQALRLVAHARSLVPAYGAQLRAGVAQAMFVQGRAGDALHTADLAVHESAGQDWRAPFIAGLAAWRLGRIELARTRFEAAFHVGSATPEQRSRAAFWAARTQSRLHDRGQYALWLQRAAEPATTFYGFLARRILGDSHRSPALADAVLGTADIAAIHAFPAGERAFALLQIGQPARAAAELRALAATVRSQPGLTRAVALVAQAAGLPDLLDESTSPLPPETPPPTLDALPVLQPEGGFQTDPALIYALARLESNFDAAVVSPSGAQGLMQLMPITAGYVLGDAATPETIAHHLHDPAENLAVGQRYLKYLAGLDAIDGNLIHLLAAYNAGPGSFARWASALHEENDPLLFMESIPVDETRAYVRRALAYTWRYAAQLHLPTPTLDDLAASRWPRFVTAEPAFAQARLH